MLGVGHGSHQRLGVAVVVLRAFPHENAARPLVFQGVTDFQRGRSGSVVGDEADVIRIAIGEIWGFGERIGVSGPASGGDELLDLMIGKTQSVLTSAIVPEAVDVEAVSVERGAEIDLRGRNVELIAVHVDGSLEAAFLTGIERAEIERRVMAGVIGPWAVKVVSHDVEKIEQRNHAGEIIDAIAAGTGRDSGGDQILSGGQQIAHGLDEQCEVEGFGLVVRDSESKSRPSYPLAMMNVARFWAKVARSVASAVMLAIRYGGPASETSTLTPAL